MARIRKDDGPPRSETVSVRFDKRMRHLLGIAATLQHRSVSSYVEWAVVQALERERTAPAVALHKTLQDELIAALREER